MRRACLAASLALPLLAQSPAPGLPGTSGWTVGVGFHTAFPTGDLAKVVNDHNGFGLALQVPLDLGSGLVLRPQLEGTGFRITRYDPFAWFLNGDEREILRTYRVGADLLVHLSGDSRRRGPYLLGGVAIQNASIDRVSQNSEGDSATTSTRLSESGTAFSFGVGLQFNAHAALEVRAYRFDYQDPAAETASAAHRRSGTAVLLGVVVKF